MDTVAILPVDAYTVEHDPAIGALLAEYAGECALAGMPQPNPRWETYELLERVGAMQCFGAYHGDNLIGFLALICNDNPHYGRVIGVVESYFVASAYRWTGAGLKLLKEAEAHARRREAVGMLVSSPLKGRLADVLPGCGYTQTNVVFFKGLG